MHISNFSWSNMCQLTLFATDKWLWSNPRIWLAIFGGRETCLSLRMITISCNWLRRPCWRGGQTSVRFNVVDSPGIRTALAKQIYSFYQALPLQPFIPNPSLSDSLRYALVHLITIWIRFGWLIAFLLITTDTFGSIAYTGVGFIYHHREMSRRHIQLLYTSSALRGMEHWADLSSWSTISTPTRDMIECNTTLLFIVHNIFPCAGSLSSLPG